MGGEVNEEAVGVVGVAGSDDAVELMGILL